MNMKARFVTFFISSLWISAACAQEWPTKTVRIINPVTAGSVTDVMARTVALLAQGAAGIVYGLNIIQHPNPAGITRALMAVVHDGASVETALTWLKTS
jgi:hypothetical protein